MSTLDFATTVRSRHSVRQFLPTPMTNAQIREITEDARRSPSSTNTQPWSVHIVSGETMTRLKKRIMEKFEQGEFRSDFVYDQSKFGGIFEPRWREFYKDMFAANGVTRDDTEGRSKITRKNAEFYGAPHAAFLFMPDVGEGNVNAASDIGMYSQTFLLSLTARGFGGIPMLFLAMFADVVREELGISPDLKLLHAIAFGYPDQDAPINQFRSKRASVDETVTFYE